MIYQQFESVKLVPAKSGEVRRPMIDIDIHVPRPYVCMMHELAWHSSDGQSTYIGLCMSTYLVPRTSKTPGRNKNMKYAPSFHRDAGSYRASHHHENPPTAFQLHSNAVVSYIGYQSLG